MSLIIPVREYLVKCLEETYDTSDPAAVMLRAIKMAEPEMDNRRRAKNTQMGIRRTLKEGGMHVEQLLLGICGIEMDQSQ